MKELYKILLLTLCLSSGLFAVINTFEDSYSIIQNINSQFASIIMPEVDAVGLIREDNENAGPGIPMKFAHAFDVDYGINNAGTWEEMDDGGKLWRLGIHSPGAYGMKVLFDAYLLPEGAELYVFSKDEDMSIGPYTHKQNHEDGTFGIPLVKSDHIVVEYYQPANTETIPQININKVFHAYLDIHNFYNDDGSSRTQCGDNVACSSADPYEDQVNSVIYLEMGQYICSAALINNTSQNLTPYVLTAEHCVVDEANLGQHNYFTFYFNHESSTCNGSGGYYGHSETGSYIRSWGSINSTSDFALLEMDDDPDPLWNPYFAGWSRYSSAPTISVGIHHPGGYAKEINFDDDQAYGCSWYSASTHWCLSWDDGGTAGGSSGSPIFNSDKQIVGQLTGGSDADCSGTDYYGKFSMSWDDGGSSSSRLKDWLDPTNTSSYTLDGTYNGNPNDDNDGDGVINGDDLDPNNMYICVDTDEDTCDDCSISGTQDPTNDGSDIDGDGICDDGDPDDDDDGCLDNFDNEPLEYSLQDCCTYFTAAELAPFEFLSVVNSSDSCFHNADIEVLDELISINSLSYDITPGIGTQTWVSNRLVSWVINYTPEGGDGVNQQLSHLSDNFGNLTSLSTLYVEWNNLTDLPESFSDLTSLTTLAISNNYLTSLPEDIGDLTNLSFLDLGYNQINSIPESIGNLQNIMYLWLFNNQLIELPETICNLDLNWDGFSGEYPYFASGGNQLCDSSLIPDCVENSVNFEISMEQFYYSFPEESLQVCCPLLGDLNADESFDVLDIIVLVNCVLGQYCSEDFDTACAGDLNGDGVYNIMDIVTLVNCILIGACNEE